MKAEICQWFDDRYYKTIRKVKDENIVDYYPSTTTKLQAVDKPGLNSWYGDLGTREAKKRTQDAADRGSRIHHALEIFAKDGIVIYNPKVDSKHTPESIKLLSEQYKNNMTILYEQDEMYDVYKVQKLFEILSPELIGIELVVCSHTNREAGTIDLLIKIDGGSYTGISNKPIKLPKGMYICDYKSGNIYDTAYMQMASYMAMIVEQNPAISKELMGSLLIHLGSSTKTGIPGLSIIHRNMEELREDYKDFRHVAAMWERQHKNSMPVLYEFPSIICRKEVANVKEN